MCGVWGFVKDKAQSLSTAEEKFIRNCALAGQVRGEDGFGIMVVYDNGVVKAFKGVGTPNDIMNDEAFFSLFFDIKKEKNKKVAVWKKIKAVFGHNRAATKGNVISRNCHPFREKHIVLMHNGTLHNKLPEGEEVDSRWVAKLMAELDDIDKVVDIINGAYVFIWHNNKTKKLNILSNGQRPLSYIQDFDTRFYASEKAMLEWIYHRVKSSNTAYKTAKSVPLHTVIEHDLFTREVKEVPTKKTVSTTTTSTTSTNTSSGSHRGRSHTGYSSQYAHGSLSPQQNNSSLEKARNRFFYKQAFPNTVVFKLRYDPHWQKLPNGERVQISVGDNQNLTECRDVLVASKSEIILVPHVKYFGSVLGYSMRLGRRVLLVDPMSVLEDRHTEKKLVDATGQAITEEHYLKKIRCLSCNIPVERHEVVRSYLTQEGLICEDCAPSYIPQLDSSDSHSNVHNLRQ